jgi:hypothetical protein
MQERAEWHYCSKSAILPQIFLIDVGFALNPCVANDGEQMTICFHVDDWKLSHRDPKVLDEIRQKYESIFEDGSGVGRDEDKLREGKPVPWG